MKHGTVADFLELAAGNEALQRDLIDLAAKHGFELTAGELTEADLEQVAGGGDTILIIDPSLKKPVAGGEPPAHF